MTEYHRNDRTYKLPDSLDKIGSTFPLDMYIHLVDYKRDVLGIEAPGPYTHPKKPDTIQYYDTMFPESERPNYYPLHRDIVELFKNPRDKRFQFKVHPMAVHMASSQIACANLFLPLLMQPDEAGKILASVKPDLARIATDRLDHGYAIEFWNDFDVVDKPGRGILNDHTPIAGTDSDLAIAYYDMDGTLCLWLIEHKLTEQEFTTCGGYRKRPREYRYKCESISSILQDPDLCHYHQPCKFKYWEITHENPQIFPTNKWSEGVCPFKGGMNQLWRNQLLAAAIEKSPDWPYEKVFFSVVHHPLNTALVPSLQSFARLTGKSDGFIWFTSAELITHAETSSVSSIREWANWYRNLYLAIY